MSSIDVVMFVTAYSMKEDDQALVAGEALQKPVDAKENKQRTEHAEGQKFQDFIHCMRNESCLQPVRSGVSELCGKLWLAQLPQQITMGGDCFEEGLL